MSKDFRSRYVDTEIAGHPFHDIVLSAPDGTEIFKGLYFSEDIFVGDVVNINGHADIRLHKDINNIIVNDSLKGFLHLQEKHVLSAIEQKFFDVGMVVPLICDGIFYYVPASGLFSGLFHKIPPFWGWSK